MQLFSWKDGVTDHTKVQSQQRQGKGENDKGEVMVVVVMVAGVRRPRRKKMMRNHR